MSPSAVSFHLGPHAVNVAVRIKKQIAFLILLQNGFQIRDAVSNTCKCILRHVMFNKCMFQTCCVGGSEYSFEIDNTFANRFELGIVCIEIFHVPHREPAWMFLE